MSSSEIKRTTASPPRTIPTIVPRENFCGVEAGVDVDVNVDVGAVDGPEVPVEDVSDVVDEDNSCGSTSTLRE